MFNYEYVRNRIGKGYDIETTQVTVGEEILFYPAQGISDLFPTAKFTLFGEDIKFICAFEVALNASEKSQLDAYIESYRTGT
jgi:hypothetical protein